MFDSERLILKPYLPRDLLALLESALAFELSFGACPAEGFRDFFVSGDVSPDWLARLRSANAIEDPWTCGFAVVLKERGLVIGTVGFGGPPDESGMVEISYAIVPAFERQGYATEAAELGTAFAFADERVHTIRAHTLAGQSPSTSVLKKCGFDFMGEAKLAEDGIVWRWERRRVSD